MDSKTLIQAYMRAKNMTQLKEVAEALDLSPSYITEMNQGRREFTDKAAISIANELGLDPTEVIIALAAVRAREPSVKAAWYDALKKYCASTGTALAVGLMTMGTLEIGMALTASNHFLC
ncbi:helix-turn-helix domain-containing protein [Aeromonas caviae]|uniref:helix-turn-helix domain-containing protein n=1 Tax=Aeromonas caviae TaxID=648 RepID=UPI0025B6E5DA|nr:helix-turn-helix domain-containing protein [Aeromonas caviae]